ncbi:MAG: dipeptidase PepE [Ginsengibacter sp.]
MNQQRILALSSSRAGESGYLAEAIPHINILLGNRTLQIAFIPFAAVNNDYETYTATVCEALQSLPHRVISVLPETAAETINKADAIMIGGGNSFKLLHDLHALQLRQLIRDKVHNGTPYIGWSAGSIMLSPGLFTTNDMPVIEPESFQALGLFPFQINPHYTNALPAGHRGETRDQRLHEFVHLHPRLPVLGLPEGTAVQLLDGELRILGERGAFLFTAGPDDTMKKKELRAGEALTYLMVGL